MARFIARGNSDQIVGNFARQPFTRRQLAARANLAGIFYRGSVPTPAIRRLQYQNPGSDFEQHPRPRPKNDQEIAQPLELNRSIRDRETYSYRITGSATNPQIIITVESEAALYTERGNISAGEYIDNDGRPMLVGPIKGSKKQTYKTKRVRTKSGRVKTVRQKRTYIEIGGRFYTFALRVKAYEKNSNRLRNAVRIAFGSRRRR